MSKRHKKAIGWTLVDIQGISPSYYIHKIGLEEGQEGTIQFQRRLNPAMKEVVKKEMIIKWLDMGVIYPIADNEWSQYGGFDGLLQVECNDKERSLPPAFH
ncbi:uncharacterized protein E6C27_scaffold437G00800 [Cucumis melo var. makuwa]|uniref:Uncharacterized protein n=1 Tax=Cucumis melo var. makuwa TaxID=1194695 RepID=A0A5A7UM85_CUCMM|nr:uncharacterized protein E6C27_scaffold437G00800 [Cucumis melo var. makuwa]